MAALGGGKEGRKEKTKSLPPSPRQNHIEAMEKPHRGGEKNPTKKKSSLRREKRALRRGSCSIKLLTSP
jgi:hypothetical protein